MDDLNALTLPRHYEGDYAMGEGSLNAWPGASGEIVVNMLAMPSGLVVQLGYERSKPDDVMVRGRFVVGEDQTWGDWTKINIPGPPPG